MQSTLKCCLWVLWLLKNSFSVKNTLYLSIYKNKRINKLEPAWLFLFSFRHLHILLVGIPLVCANLWVFCRHWEAVTAPPLPQASGQIFKQSPLCSRLQLTLHYLNLTSQLASQLCPVFFTPFSLISRSSILPTFIHSSPLPLPSLPLSHLLSSRLLHSVSLPFSPVLSPPFPFSSLVPVLPILLLSILQITS